MPEKLTGLVSGTPGPVRIGTGVCNSFTNF